MTKAEVKALCEDDDKLQWWAMVLFAEISDVAGPQSGYANDDQAVAMIARAKVAEFQRFIIHRQLEKIKEKETT